MSDRSQADPLEKLTSRALIVWGVGLLLYIMSIFGRTSFGVAGVKAIDRFGVDASHIAVFTAVQVGVYAFMQIPMGLNIDRFGPRRMLITGALIMAAGQVILALTSSYSIAIGARVLIGAGDAAGFLSVLRLIPSWFPPRKAPLFTQFTAGFGQLGQFISAVPFLAYLNATNWQTAFLTVGALGALVALLGGVALADAPKTSVDTPVAPSLPFKQRLTAVLRNPLCWQAFFIHWSGMLHQVVFTMLWGLPMLTLGLGLSNAQAGAVLTANTLANMACGPLLGFISQRSGARRDVAAIALTSIIGISWALFLLPVNPPNMAAALILNILMSFFTPTSNFGFDTVRSRVDHRVVATGTGLGNMGGFLSAMVAAQLVGILLDKHSGGAPLVWGDFRYAYVIVELIWIIGIVGIAVMRRFVPQEHRGTGEPVKIVEQTDED